MSKRPKANKGEQAPSIVPTPEELIEQMGSKSAAIRKLSAEGKTRSEIADFLGIRYQHVRNVLLMPLTKRQTTETK